MSCSIDGMEDSGCIFLFGYNPNSSHPLVARRIIKAKEKGAKIIVADPRFIETARIADIYMPLRNGSNVAFLNSFAHAIVTEGLVAEDFVREHVTNFDEWWETIKHYAPERTQDLTGIDPATLRRAAHLYAEAPSAIICWGMGICQQKQNVHAVHTAGAIAAITHQIGKPSSGVAPVRGQNNVQGACDMGAMPEYYVGYQDVTNEAIREKFAKHWNVPVEKLSNRVGYRVTQLGELIRQGKIHAFYNFGEDPLQTDPDTNHLRQAYKMLDLFVCQDIFMTQTASEADVILPATSWGEHEGTFVGSDRTIQYFSAAVPPKGECRHDWEIFCEIAQRMGYDMHYKDTKDIWDREAREVWPNSYGITYEKLAGLGYAQWPCLSTDPSDHGARFLFEGGKFTTHDHKCHLIAHEFEAPTEMPDDLYPLVLCSVREVGHYSCRSMTGNCEQLVRQADEPGYIHINPADAQERGIKHDELVWVYSRRGKIIVRAWVDDRANRGACYMTYQWWIGKVNAVLLDHIDDERSYTPESKYASIQVERIEDQTWAEQYFDEEYMTLKEQLAKSTENQYADDRRVMVNANIVPDSIAHDEAMAGEVAR